MQVMKMVEVADDPAMRAAREQEKIERFLMHRFLKNQTTRTTIMIDILPNNPERKPEQKRIRPKPPALIAQSRSTGSVGSMGSPKSVGSNSPTSPIASTRSIFSPRFTGSVDYQEIVDRASVAVQATVKKDLKRPAENMAQVVKFARLSHDESEKRYQEMRDCL